MIIVADFFISRSGFFSVSLQVFMKHFISSLSFIVIKMDFYEGDIFFYSFLGFECSSETGLLLQEKVDSIDLIFSFKKMKKNAV